MSCTIAVRAEGADHLPVPIPPLSLQTRFAQFVAEIQSIKAEQATSRARQSALFQSMLHHALNVEL
jgi:restriction endonuclease S subunit